MKGIVCLVALLINIGIIVTYIMVFGAALAVLGFSVMQMIKSPKNAKKTLYTVGGLVVVLIISYLIASSEVLPSYEKYKINSFIKLKCTGLTNLAINNLSINPS